MITSVKIDKVSDGYEARVTFQEQYIQLIQSNTLMGIISLIEMKEEQAIAEHKSRSNNS